MPGSWRNMYEPGEVPIPVGTLAPEEQVRIQTERVKTDCNGNKKSALRSRCVNRAREQLEPETEEEQRIFIAEFYAMISSIDDSVGRILDDLDRLGITDDTKVVFFSDHCDMPGDHVYDCGCKPQGYRAAMQVPLLIRYLGRVAAGRRTSEMIDVGVDMPVTLIDLVGAAPFVRQTVGASCPFRTEVTITVT